MALRYSVCELACWSYLQFLSRTRARHWPLLKHQPRWLLQRSRWENELWVQVNNQESPPTQAIWPQVCDWFTRQPLQLSRTNLDHRPRMWLKHWAHRVFPRYRINEAYSVQVCECYNAVHQGTRPVDGLCRGELRTVARPFHEHWKG